MIVTMKTIGCLAISLFSLCAMADQQKISTTVIWKATATKNTLANGFGNHTLAGNSLEQYIGFSDVNPLVFYYSNNRFILNHQENYHELAHADNKWFNGYIVKVRVLKNKIYLSDKINYLTVNARWKSKRLSSDKDTVILANNMNDNINGLNYSIDNPSEIKKFKNSSEINPVGELSLGFSIYWDA